MRAILFILTSILCTGNFTSKTKPGDYRSSEKYEIEIIAQTLPELLRPIQPPPPPSFVGSTQKIIEFNDSNENVKTDFKRRVDTTIFTVHLVDKLVIPDKSELMYLKDSMYFGLAGILRADTLSAKSICATAIDSLCQFKLLLESPPNFKELGFIYLGSAIYSRIVFDDNFKLALFYFVCYRDEDDSSGRLILVEHQNDKWIIKRDDLIWIS